MVLKEHNEKRSSYWACFGRFLLVPRGGRRDREAERRVRVRKTKEQTNNKKKEGRGGL